VGYLKDRVADVTEFVEALDRVARGGTALAPEVVSQLFSMSQTPRRPNLMTPNWVIQ
jgi:DNA-binding NarL/FixJ family response regulator